MGSRKIIIHATNVTYVSNSSKKLKSHIKAVHGALELNVFLCCKVFRSTKEPYIIGFHIPCDFKCFRSQNLKKHVDSEHKGIRYYCDKCPRSSKQKYNLDTHLIHQCKSLTSNSLQPEHKAHKCNQCTFSTFKRSESKEHVANRHEWKTKSSQLYQCGHVAKCHATLKEYIAVQQEGKLNIHCL